MDIPVAYSVSDSRVFLNFPPINHLIKHLFYLRDDLLRGVDENCVFLRKAILCLLIKGFDLMDDIFKDDRVTYSTCLLAHG